jgi:hypothetical protein
MTPPAEIPTRVGSVAPGSTPAARAHLRAYCSLCGSRDCPSRDDVPPQCPLCERLTAAHVAFDAPRRREARPGGVHG